METCWRFFVSLVFASLICVACRRTHAPERDEGGTNAPHSIPRSVSEKLGTRFFADTFRFSNAPRLRDVTVPEFPGAASIWGATGRDDAGTLYFGVSAQEILPASARLLQLKSNDLSPSIVGDVLDQLEQNDTLRTGESQMKIHSKIFQADDGNLYFASLDENGEREDGSAYPTWGGHLWRIRPGKSTWEHLLTTKEALIALATTGRYIFALGYFNHVVYQFDVETGVVKSTTVGSVGGHISRNLLADLRGHVYVPRVTVEVASTSEDSAVSDWNDRRVRSSLVELDSELQEVKSWPLPDYDPTPDAESHGIVGYAMCENGKILFTTHSGALWQITPGDQTEPSRLERLGWYHPQGRSYTTTLVCPTGRDMLCGLSQPPSGEFEWVVYDLPTRTSRVLDLDDRSMFLLNRPNLLVYGTNTMDNFGNAYYVGWIRVADRFRPHIMKVEWPEAK